MMLPQLTIVKHFYTITTIFLCVVMIKSVSVYGFEGLYEVDENCVFTRLERVDSLGRVWPKKQLKPQFLKNKYQLIQLKKPGEKAKGFPAHRVMMQSFYGYSDLEVDHIDGNPSNNHLSNLEYVTRRENMRRAFSKNKKCAGVSFHKRDKTWTARIYINGVMYSLGTFKTEEEAIAVRRRADKEFDETGDVSFKVPKKPNPFPRGIQRNKNTGKFYVRFYKNGKEDYRGTFKTLEDAKRAAQT